MIGDKSLFFMEHSKTKNKNGFTLVELLVSIFVFFLIVGAIMNIFISGIETQKKILRDQKTISELSYVMEHISRSLRMAIRDNDGNCIASGYNYQLINTLNESGIRFLNYKNQCQEYYLNSEEGKIYEKKSEDENYNPNALPLELTSKNVVISRFYFNEAESGWHSTSNNQPKVMINLQFKAVGGDLETILQTVVSQRNININ